jgi:hypothetical protein
VRSLKPLFKRNLAEDLSTKGMRSKMLRLTDEGDKTLAYAKILWCQAQKELELRLGEDNLSSLYEIISLLQKA